MNKLILKLILGLSMVVNISLHAETKECEVSGDIKTIEDAARVLDLEGQVSFSSIKGEITDTSYKLTEGCKGEFTTEDGEEISCSEMHEAGLEALDYFEDEDVHVSNLSPFYYLSKTGLILAIVKVSKVDSCEIKGFYVSEYGVELTTLNSVGSGIMTMNPKNTGAYTIKKLNSSK